MYIVFFCCYEWLFVFCACSVLGMNLFGGKYCWREDGIPCTCDDQNNPSIRCQCDRANFNTLLWSLVTVFQVNFGNQCLYISPKSNTWVLKIYLQIHLYRSITSFAHSGNQYDGFENLNKKKLISLF